MEVERQHYNVTLAILTLAGTAFALRQTMVIPALPTLQRELHTTTTWVTWVLTVFLNAVMRTVGGVVGGQIAAALLTAHPIPGTWSRRVRDAPAPATARTACGRNHRGRRLTRVGR